MLSPATTAPCQHPTVQRVASPTHATLHRWRCGASHGLSQGPGSHDHTTTLPAGACSLSSQQQLEPQLPGDGSSHTSWQSGLADEAEPTLTATMNMDGHSAPSNPPSSKQPHLTQPAAWTHSLHTVRQHYNSWQAMVAFQSGLVST